MGVLALSVLLLCLVAQPASADAPDSQEIPRAAQDSGMPQRTCYDLTDGCVVCISDESGAHCSTPGVACQPDVIRCRGTLP